MPVCTRCNLDKPENAFKKLNSGNRGSVCYRCNKGLPPLQQSTPDVDQVLTDAEILESQKTPLQTAYDTRAAERAKRDLRKEHSALLEENETLRAKLGEVEKIGSGPRAAYHFVRADPTKGDA